MGAKDWMVMYSDGEIASVLRQAPRLDRDATRAVVARLYPGRQVALDRPSQLDERFLAEAQGRTVYLHAMHSVVDWFAYAIWDGDGELRRSLSLSSESGILENARLAFEFSGRR